MLQDIEFADEKQLKMFYNYNCSTIRMHYDFKLLVQEELADRRKDPKIMAI